MRSSALFLGTAGVGASFLPQELLAAIGAPPLLPLVLVIQLLGATYVGLGMLNWMSQGSLIGGIYSRPIAVGNLTHFVMGFLALVKSIKISALLASMIALAIVYGVFAAWFGLVLRTHPVRSKPEA